MSHEDRIAKLEADLDKAMDSIIVLQRVADGYLASIERNADKCAESRVRPRTKYEENFEKIEDDILKMLLSSGYENTPSNVHAVCSRLAVDLLPGDPDECAVELKAAFDRAAKAGILVTQV